MRERGVRALHGVPLLASGELIGVAHIGSVRVDEFADWDRRLFAAMATRASAGIALHLAREAERARLVQLDEKEAELRRAIRDREEESARVAAILENAPVGIGFWDRDLRLVRANRRLAELDGLPPEDHPGRTPSELLPGIEGIRELEARWRETLESGSPEAPREIVGETPSAPGQRRWFSENAYAVRVDGETLGLGALLIDVTDQKRAEQELAFLAQASRELADWVDWDTTLDRIARLGVPRFADWCSVVLVDDDGAPRRVTLHGRDPRAVDEGRRIAAEYPVDVGPLGLGAVLREGTPRLVPSVADAREEPAGGGGALDMLVRLGIHSWLAAPLLARGRILGALSYGISGSRRRFDARDLAFAGELARRCAIAIDNARLFQDTRREAELRQRVLAVVSHDLRNPLSTILFSASRAAGLAAPGEAGDKLRRSAETIRRSAERMNRLINDLLDVAAIQAGKLSVKPAPQAAGALLREVAEAFQAPAREKGLALEVAAGPELPRVTADRDRVIQALGNLVGNAIKVTKAGRVALSAEPAGPQLVFRVADTGPGIAPDVLPRLFDPYVRGRDAPYSGTGLGLSIAKGIAEAHGGRIGAESEPGKGSTFWLALPIAP
jgi:PAS domain S-box-containing protein